MSNPRLAFQPVQVNTASRDVEGRLVLADDQLVAVLVRLDGEEHGRLCGSWHLEAGFGPCCESVRKPFRDLRDAERWVRERLKVYGGVTLE